MITEGDSGGASWSNARFLKRTMMSLKELLAFGTGDGRRSLYTYSYSGELCASAPNPSAERPHEVCSPERLREIQRSATFSVPEMKIGQREHATWSCEAQDDCPRCHSTIEVNYHFDNYKRFACSHLEHLCAYPPHVQREMGISQTEGGLSDDDCVRLQLCPFYHSIAERDAWESWRQAYLGFSPWDAADSSDCRRHLELTTMFGKMGQALERLCERAATQVGRVESGDVGALALQPIDVLVLAAEMEESCTHRVLCFMMFAEFALPAVQLVWPDSNTSASLRLRSETLWNSNALIQAKETYAERCVWIDPLTTDVLSFVTPDHLCAIGEWLLVAGRLVGHESFIPLKFFPHCTHDPFGHTIPHKYYAYLGYVSNALVNRQQGSDEVLAPLSFLLNVSSVVLLGLSHWIVTQGWIRRRSIDVPSIEAFLADRGIKAAEEAS